MKEFFAKNLSATLLVGYVIFTTFTNISIAHSIILFSLAGLFAYHQFLLSRQQPKLEAEIAKLKSEMEEQIKKLKESHDKKLSELDGELSKISLSVVRSSSSPSSKSPEAKAYKF